MHTTILSFGLDALRLIPPLLKVFLSPFLFHTLLTSNPSVNIYITSVIIPNLHSALSTSSILHPLSHSVSKTCPIQNSFSPRPTFWTFLAPYLTALLFLDFLSFFLLSVNCFPLIHMHWFFFFYIYIWDFIFLALCSPFITIFKKAQLFPNFLFYQLP